MTKTTELPNKIVQKLLDGQKEVKEGQNQVQLGIKETNRCEGMEKRITVLETSKNEVMEEFKMLLQQKEREEENKMTRKQYLDMIKEENHNLLMELFSSSRCPVL